MFPDPLQAIAAFARVAHHASFKRCRISSGAAGDIYSGDLVRVYVRLIYRRLGTFRQSDFDRLSSTRICPSDRRRHNGGFQGTTAVHPFKARVIYRGELSYPEARGRSSMAGFVQRGYERVVIIRVLPAVMRRPQ